MFAGLRTAVLFFKEKTFGMVAAQREELLAAACSVVRVRVE
jgi:hypothetical protein